ncbi:MAG: hypothetical protein N3E47_06030 [Candidatus Bathyarchaeota archaeon]|nr:hypothetical protein [Candidatus Bathyarchaeota archaeon]
MPEPGYTSLIVRESVRKRLEELARAEGFRTVSQLLEALLRVYPNTAGVNPECTPGQSHKPLYTHSRARFKPSFKNRIGAGCGI